MTRNKDMILPIKEHLADLERVKNPAATRFGYLRLDKNENTVGFPRKFIEKLKDVIDSDFLTAYPEPGFLYRKIAEWFGCGEENVYVTAGSDAGIKAVFEVFVKKGDTVVLLDPTYAMFYVYTGMFQGNLVKIRYGKDLSLSAEDIVKAINKNMPKLVCIANPNSPTGTILPSEDIEKIVDTAACAGSIILLDEAYYPYYPVSSSGLIRRYSNLVVTRTFSKAMGLASTRLGFAAGQSGIIESLHKVRPMYETNAFAVKFAELILDNYHLVEEGISEVNKAKMYVEDQLSDLKIPYFKSYANFMLIDAGSPEDAVKIKNVLYSRKILIKAGFDDEALKSCIRISIGSVSQMEHFMKNFVEVLT